MGLTDKVARAGYHRSYYLANREEMLKTANEHYHANRLTVLAQKRNYWSLNAVRLKANRQRKRQELRLRLLVHYGGGVARCVCCLESEIMFLSIDHIANNGADHRREIGVDALHRWLEKSEYPEGYQTMCMNCNWGKHRNGGVCPHQGGR